MYDVLESSDFISTEGIADEQGRIATLHFDEDGDVAVHKGVVAKRNSDSGIIEGFTNVEHLTNVEVGEEGAAFVSDDMEGELMIYVRNFGGTAIEGSEA